MRLGAVVDVGRRGGLKGEFLEPDLGVQLDVRVSQLDFARDRSSRSSLSRRSGRPSGPMRRVSKRPRAFGPRERACTASRRPCPGRAWRPWGCKEARIRRRRPGRPSGPTRPWRVLQVPRNFHTFLPSSSSSSLRSNLSVLLSPTSSVSGPANAHLGDGLFSQLGIELGRIEPLQDRLDAQLAVNWRIEHNLVIPKSFAVADLKRGGGGVGKPRDGEAAGRRGSWGLCDSFP